MVAIQVFNPHALPFTPSHHFFDDTVLANVDLSLLESLPDPILVSIFDHLSSSELCKVAAVSRGLRSVVVSFSASDRIRSTLSSPLAAENRTLGERYKTMKKSFELLSIPLQLLRVEDAAENRRLGCFSVNQEASWQSKAMPVMKADETKMVLGIGNDLWASFEGSNWTISRLASPGIGDISDLTMTNIPNEIIVSFVDGRIERLRLGRSDRAEQPWNLVNRLRSESRNSVEAIDYKAKTNALLSVYLHGQLILNWSNIQLGCRPWCTKFVRNGNKIATGTRSDSPLKVHEATETGLRAIRSYSAPGSPITSVFAVEPITENVILSGWYDGYTRMHDLRISSHEAVSCWRDPYGDAAVYSLSTTGNHIYSGSAVNGVVQFFDFRNTKPGSGISLFLGPKGERGPVYSLISEHEVVYGAMERCVRAADFYQIPRKGHHMRGDSNASRNGACTRHCCGLLAVFADSCIAYVNHNNQTLAYSLPTRRMSQGNVRTD